MQTNKERTKVIIQNMISRYRDWTKENNFNLKRVDTDVQQMELGTENYMLGLFIHDLNEICGCVDAIVEITA